MSGVSGPELDELVEDLRKWFSEQVDWMVERLSEGYPFGSTPLSELEQLQRYRAMQQQDWAALIQQREAIHRGKPNTRELVQQDINDYVGRMQTLARKYRGAPNGPQP